MEANHPSLRRSATQRFSLRSSKRLARSTSGTSPLARNLLRSLHEQKRAALAEQRARRWEIYAVVNQNVLPRPRLVELSEEKDDHLVPTSIHQPEIPIVTESFYEEARKYDVQQKSSKKGGLIKFRTVKKQVSKVVTRIFPRKSDKQQVPSFCSATDHSQLKSYRMLQSTVL